MPEPERDEEQEAEEETESTFEYQPRATPQLTLSTTTWDPQQPAFDPATIADLQLALAEVLEQLSAKRAELESAGSGLGLLDKNEAVYVPESWDTTPGSPTYYMRVAEGYVDAARRGIVCRAEHPPAQRSQRPPPENKWCCSHNPPHCIET